MKTDRLLPIFLFAACPHEESSRDSTSYDTARSATTADSVPLDSTPVDDSTGCTWQCPEGMVAVTEAGVIRYCVDVYEALVENGQAISRKGVIPTLGETYDAAVAACANTPLYTSAGMEYGRKRLARSQEWEDAADGVVGDGGSTYPYGDMWVEGACATPSADGTITITSVQPTGSFAKCISAFGTFDQVGNAWEWADSGLRVDSQAAIKTFAANGITLSVESQTSIVLVEGDLRGLRIDIPGASNTLTTDADGRLYVQSVEVLVPSGGYLLPQTAGKSQTGWVFYPVTIWLDQDVYWVVYHADLDGQPVPDKRGCSYYTNGLPEDACKNNVASYAHTHDFNGTIGVRCAADPFCG